MKLYIINHHHHFFMKYFYQFTPTVLEPLHKNFQFRLESWFISANIFHFLLVIKRYDVKVTSAQSPVFRIEYHIDIKLSTSIIISLLLRIFSGTGAMKNSQNWLNSSHRINSLAQCKACSVTRPFNIPMAVFIFQPFHN